MKNKLLLLAVVVIVGALLYYCFNTGNKSEDVSAAAGETYKLEYTPTLQAYGFTEPVILKAKPQRVVSLVHTPVLALYEMGIKQVAVPQAAMLEWPAHLPRKRQPLCRQQKEQQFSCGLHQNRLPRKNCDYLHLKAEATHRQQDPVQEWTPAE